MSPEGTWNVVIHTPIGKQQVVLQVQHHQGIWTGSARQGNETVPLLNVQCTEDNLTWEQEVTRPLRLRLAFEVKCMGDHMTGTVRSGKLPASRLEGTRQF